jgi:hypothetical protein
VRHTALDRRLLEAERVKVAGFEPDGLPSAIDEGGR